MLNYLLMFSKVVVCRKDENEDPGSPFIDVEGLSDEDAEPLSRTLNANKEILPSTSQSVSERGKIFVCYAEAV